MNDQPTEPVLGDEDRALLESFTQLIEGEWRPELPEETLARRREQAVHDLAYLFKRPDLASALLNGAEQPGDDHQRVWRGSELLANPDILKVPKPISPTLAYEERLTIAAAREKEGKSTYTRWDMAVASHTMPCGWITYEESLSDIVRGFDGFGWNPDNVFIGEDLTPAEILLLIREHDLRYVVIDSFATFVGHAFGKIPQTSEGELWQKHTLELKRLAKETGAAIVTLAHSPKGADGTIRGSTGIAAAADMIVGMLPPKKNEPANLRTLVFRGRWSVDPIKVRFHSNGFTTGTELDFTDASIEGLVYEFVAANEGCYSREIREGVQGKSQLIDAALKELIERGVIVKTRDSHGYAHIAERAMHVDELTGELLEGEDENEGWGRSEPRGEA